MDQSNTSKKCTLQDVANMARVSVSTVSHVLNGTAKISEPTKQRVMEAVHTLRYRPLGESGSRLLRQNRKAIGVIVQDIRNEFYAACAGSVLNCADNTGYTVILCDCGYSRQREADLVRELIYQDISGLIFFGGTENAEPVTMADGYGIPVVLANRHVDGFSSVMFSNTKIIRDLITALCEAGRKRYLYLSESPELQSIRDRIDGFCLGMMDHHIPDDSYQILTDKRLQRNKVDAAYTVLQEHLRARGLDFDTVITSSDLIAIGAMKCLQDGGCRVPEDVWVVGYDDISVSSMVSPPLTTVRQNTDRLGEEAFLLLHEIMHTEHYRPKQIMIENTLVIRSSALGNAHSEPQIRKEGTTVWPSSTLDP